MVITSMRQIYMGVYRVYGWEGIYQSAASNMGMIFIFVLLSSVTLTMYRMFQSKDLFLLMSLPTRDSSLFLAKLFDCLSDVARTMILPFPVCIAFIIVISGLTSPYAGLIFFVGWILILVQLAGLSFVIALLLGKFMLNTRMANFMRVISVIVALLFLVILMLYVQNNDSKNLLNFLSFSVFFPSAWLIRLLPNSGSELLSKFFYVFGFVAFTLVCPIVAFGLFKMRFRRLWAMTMEVSRKGAKKSKAKKSISEARSIGKTRALILKDALSIFREPHTFIGLLLPLILFPVFFILSGRQTENQSLYIVIAALLSTASFSISCIGREGRTFSLLRALPISTSLLLRAKFFLNWFVSFFITSTFVLAFYIFQKATVNQLLYNFFIAIITSLYFSVIGTGIAALFPRFDFTNPMRAVSMPGMLGLYLTAGLFSATVVFMRYVSWYFIPLILAPWTIIALILIKISVKRLEKIDL